MRSTLALALLLSCRWLELARGADAPPTCPWMGVNIHFTGAPALDLDLIRAAGFGLVRTDLPWDRIEREPGVDHFEGHDALLDGLSQRGLGALFILDYGHRVHTGGRAPSSPAERQAFARFAARAVQRYRGRDVLWEVWNEPNLAQFWKPEPSAADYAALLGDTVSAVRAVDPKCQILAPGSSGFPWGFLEFLVRGGALREVSAVSVHPYRGTPPETVTEDLDRLRELLRGTEAQGAVPQRIVSSEWGYSVRHHGGERISEDLQASYLARLMLVCRSRGLERSIWYDWANDGLDPAETEHNFGVVRADRSLKPAYHAARTVARAARGGSRAVARLAAPGIHVIDLDGGTALWTEGDRCAVGFQVASAGGRPVVTSLTGETRELPARGGRVVVDAGGAPLFLGWSGEGGGPLFSRVHSLGQKLHARRILVDPYTGGPGATGGVLFARVGTGPSALAASQEITLEEGKQATVEFPVSWSPEEPVRVEVKLLEQGTGDLLAALPTVDYGLARPFAVEWPPEEQAPAHLKVSLDGDPSVAADAVAALTTTRELGTGKEPVLRLEYRFGAGWRFASLVPDAAHAAIRGRPSALTLWVRGDGSGNALRFRLRDARGETFQVTAAHLSWRGWRRLTVPLDGNGASSWGGGEQGRGQVDYPLSWESFLLVDSTREASSGSVEIANPLLVQHPE